MIELPQYIITENGVVDNRVIFGQGLQLAYRLAAESTDPDAVHQILQEFQSTVSGDERGWVSTTALWVVVVDILGLMLKGAPPHIVADLAERWREKSENIAGGH